MAICNRCALEFDDSLPACTSCHEPNPHWKADGANASLLKKEEGPVPANSDEVGGLGDHHIVFPRKEILSWLRKHRKAVGKISLVSLLLTIVGGWFVHDWWKGRQRPQPVAIWIDGGRAEVAAGTKLRLTARTSPDDYLPDKFIWSPPELIEGNGQQSVILDTKSDDRLTEHNIEVRLVAFDNLGYVCPHVTPVVIKVVPQAQLNSKPEWQDHIQMEFSPEGRSGSYFKT